MPLPIINLKQAFAAQRVLPAASMCSKNNKNKNVDTKNKQNVSDGKNCFLLIETMNTDFFFPMSTKQIWRSVKQGGYVILWSFCSVRVREIWTCCWEWVSYISNKKIYEILQLIVLPKSEKGLFEIWNTTPGERWAFYVILRTDGGFISSNLDYVRVAKNSDTWKHFLALIRTLTHKRVKYFYEPVLRVIYSSAIRFPAGSCKFSCKRIK